MVLVPLVLADRRGTRIGHGKGHYDRALSHLREGGRPVFTIGLGWDARSVDEPIPADPWDITLDAVATPEEWIACALEPSWRQPAGICLILLLIAGWAVLVASVGGADRRRAAWPQTLFFSSPGSSGSCR